ncbi:MAG: hypothetical protein GX591_11845 [Planctomycetes bacterium]|nr:hypothetical protein [Planctomycetota bacterium]
MTGRDKPRDPARTLDPDVTDLVIRGVFAFTLAMAEAAASLGRRRRERQLERQDPRLN